MVEGACLRKRKGDHLVEDPERLIQPGKSRRRLVEDDDTICVETNSRTNSPILWGAKSGIGRETTYGQKNIMGNGLDLKTLRAKEGGTSLGLDDGKTENQINSQRIQ